MYTILVINLGGTSTKLSIYDGLELKAEKSLNHPVEEVKTRPLASQQLEYRKELILDWLSSLGMDMDSFSAVAVRGATVKVASRGGTYRVTGVYKELLLELFVPEKPLVHGIRVVTPLALTLVGERNIPIYITDPPSVNQLQEIARFSGLAEYERRARFHALNQRMVARKHAETLGKRYEDCCFVVAHLGGGISIGAHEHGRVVDVSDAGDGYGPFSTDRAGTVATEAMLDMCFARALPYDEVYAKIRGGGGLMSHLGTTDLREVEARAAAGENLAALVFNAMCYQIGKEIASYAAVLKGKAEGILLTGGLSRSEKLVALLSEYVEWISPVTVYAGEYENEALAAGAYRVLSGQEQEIIL